MLRAVTRGCKEHMPLAKETVFLVVFSFFSFYVQQFIMHYLLLRLIYTRLKEEPGSIYATPSASISISLEDCSFSSSLEVM